MENGCNKMDLKREDAIRRRNVQFLIHRKIHDGEVKHRARNLGRRRLRKEEGTQGKAVERGEERHKSRI